MPRSPRIEYPDACYHILARGNRRQPIVFDDDDRRMFEHTLAQACSRTGWQVFAWVLLDNHYHIALRTPEPNLVAGMSWFQNTFTRRINVKHQLWGHLFGGRYKSILVESGTLGSNVVWKDYLRVLIDYIHLNPVRAGIVDGESKSLLDYPWCSIARAYAKPPTKRPDWVAAAEGLDLFGNKDDTRGRRHFVERLDRIARAERGESAGCAELDGQSLQSTLRRGWYWGSMEFREKVLDRFGKQQREKKRRDRNTESSEMARDHAQKQAESILTAATRHFEISAEELMKPRRGDLTRAAVAWAIWKETSVRMQWLAEKLSMRSAANASQQVRRFDQKPDRELTPKVRQWKKSRVVT